MIVGIGVDVVDIERFGRQLERTPGLRDRLFVPAERELNTRSLAARFAAKEAVAKVLGAPAGMNWQDCWIGLDHNGPTVQVKGTVLAVAEAKGVKRWHLSISHDGSTDLCSAVGADHRRRSLRAGPVSPRPGPLPWRCRRRG